MIWEQKHEYEYTSSSRNINTIIIIILTVYETHSEMTSGGKLLGIDPVLAHKALSLLQVHDAGQRACLLLLPLTDINRQTKQMNTARLKVILTKPMRL